jgi:hypothetical protein
MAAQSWQAGKSSGVCPDLTQIQSDRYLDPGQSVTDPWGTDYAISCGGADITVSSAGPDRRWTTGDDIFVPRRLNE